MEMKWEHISSFIPFLKHWTPSDNYHIFKRGSHVRVDMSLIGYKNSEWQRGAWTILFKGREAHNAGSLLLLDNEKGTIVDLFGDLPITNVEKKVDRLIHKEEESANKEMVMQDLQFNVSKTWRGEQVVENIKNIQTYKYQAKGNLVQQAGRPISISNNN
jgi:hypothetical protein